MSQVTAFLHLSVQAQIYEQDGEMFPTAIAILGSFVYSLPYWRHHSKSHHLNKKHHSQEIKCLPEFKLALICSSAQFSCVFNEIGTLEYPGYLVLSN